MTAEEWAAEIMTWGYEGEPHHLVSILRNVIAEEREACAQIAESYTIAVSPTSRPTIAELEAILASTPDPVIEIMPSGEITATPMRSCLQIAAAIRARSEPKATAP